MTGSVTTAPQCLAYDGDLASDAAPALDAAPSDVMFQPMPATRLPISEAHQVRLVAILMVADLFVMTTAWFTLPDIPAAEDWTIFPAVIGAALCIQGTGYAVGLYDARTAARLQGGWPAQLGLGLLAAVLAILFAHGAHNTISPMRIASTGAVVVLTLLLLRLGLAAWMDRNVASLSERLVLVGTADAVSCLLTPDLPWHVAERVVGWIAIGDSGHAIIEPMATFDPQTDDTSVILNDAWRIGDALRGCRTRIDRVVIVAADFGETAVAATLKRLEHLPFEIALLPPTASLCETQDQLDRVNGLILRRPAITQWGLVGKRALDIMAASILLILISPLMLLIALLVRLGSPGPALFRQTRWGWNNVPFTVLKFRTMWSNAHAADGSIQATRNDKRITPVGSFLRRSSLDELPQLLNVLNGTMSLVGPRPHPVELNRRYLGLINRYADRHRILPGITGLAQVMGFRGETPDPSIMQRRVELDLEYIRRRSLGTDIWILFRTVVSLVRATNAR